MTVPDATANFADIALPHLEGAYTLAHWLMRDRSAAEDVVQEAMLRALNYYSTFNGTNARAWILRIVRNVAYQHLNASREVAMVSIDDALAHDAVEALIDPCDDPIETLLKQREQGYLSTLIERLPVHLRECLVLRELEDFSYKEIAQIVDIPLGTVMSRLWRARCFLINAVQKELR